MQNPNAPVALLAGLLGGILSHYVLLQLVPVQTPTAPNVVAARSFVLIDSSGQPAGVFAVGAPSPQQGSAPSIVLYDAQGREIWRATDSARPLTIAQ